MNEICGIFLSLSPKEKTLIDATLSEEGYDATPAGLKAWIIAEMEAEEEAPHAKEDRNLGDHIGAFLRENPDTVSMYTGLGAAALKGAVDKIAAGLIKKTR